MQENLWILVGAVPYLLQGRARFASRKCFCTWQTSSHCCWGNGATPAHFAAADGHVGVLRELIKSGVEAWELNGKIWQTVMGVSLGWESRSFSCHLWAKVVVRCCQLCLVLLLVLLWFVTSLALRTCRGWTMQGGLWHTMLPRRRGERSQDLSCPKSSRKFKGSPNWFKCERRALCTKSFYSNAGEQIPNGIPGRSSVGKAFAAFNFLLFQCHVVIPLFFAYWFLVDQAALQFN